MAGFLLASLKNQPKEGFPKTETHPAGVAHRGKPGRVRRDPPRLRHRDGAGAGVLPVVGARQQRPHDFEPGSSDAMES